MKTTIVILSCILFLGVGGSIAQAAQDTKDPSEMMGAGMMNGDTMGMMDMNQMMGMLDQCQSMHKDGKTCEHQMMNQCQENMDKKECMNMMRQAKRQIKKNQKK